MYTEGGREGGRERERERDIPTSTIVGHSFQCRRKGLKENRLQKPRSKFGEHVLRRTSKAALPERGYFDGISQRVEHPKP